MKRSRRRSDVADAAASSLIDARRIFYFFHVARAGSFTTAEMSLDVAQPALSRQIRQLEEDLGVKLLERRGHGVEMTETGRDFYTYAEQILQLMEEAIKRVEQSKSAPRDRVSLAAPRPFSTRFFPTVLLRYNQRFPRTHITTHEASSGQVYEMLTNGLVDLAVIMQQPNSPKVVGTRLFEEELLVTGRSDNELLQAPYVSRSKLPMLNLILPAAPLGTREILEDYFQQNGINVDPIMRFDSVSLMKEIIRKDGYCAILPAMACEEELRSGEFIALSLRPKVKRTLHLAYLRDRRQTEAVRAMHDEIISAVREAGLLS